MAIGGDPGDIRAMAARVRSWADDVDDQAAEVRRAKGVEWTSAAADAFIARIEQRYADTRAVAESMREAAGRLDHLADTLEDRQRTLMNLLEQAGRTLDEAEQMVRDGVDDILGEVSPLASAAKDAAGDLIDGGKDLLGKVL